MKSEYDALMEKYLALHEDHSDLQIRMIAALKSHCATQEKLKEALDMLDYAAMIFDRIAGSQEHEQTGDDLN